MTFYPEHMERIYEEYQNELMLLRHKYRTQISDQYIELLRQQLDSFLDIQKRRIEQYQCVYETLGRTDMDMILQEVLLENIQCRYRQLNESMSELAHLFGFTQMHNPVRIHEMIPAMEQRVESLSSLCREFDLRGVKAYVQNMERICATYEKELAPLVAVIDRDALTPPPRPLSRVQASQPAGVEVHLALVSPPAHTHALAHTHFEPAARGWPSGPGPV